MDEYTVSADSVSHTATSGDVTIASTSGSTVITSGTSTDITAATTASISATNDITLSSVTDGVTINADTVKVSNLVQFETYGDTAITGTFTTFLAVDVDGNVIEVTAEQILATETDSVIYRHDGTLTSDRYMTMDGNDLFFIDGSDTTVITSNGRMAIGRGSVTTALMPGREIKLEVNGDILAMQIHSSSDERFKKNITQVSGALEKVMAINGVNYDFRVDEFKGYNFPTERQVGFLAQNVEAVMPEVVKTNGDGYKSVDYAKLTAVLNEAIKEQQLLIKGLQKEILSANTQNAKLASEIATIKELLQGLSSQNVSDED